MAYLCREVVYFYASYNQFIEFFFLRIYIKNCAFIPMLQARTPFRNQIWTVLPDGFYQSLPLIPVP